MAHRTTTTSWSICWIMVRRTGSSSQRKIKRGTQQLRFYLRAELQDFLRRRCFHTIISLYKTFSYMMPGRSLTRYVTSLERQKCRLSTNSLRQASRLITVPMFHAYAFPIAHLSALREGIPTYIMSRFEIHKYLSNIEKYQITETAMVPAIMHTIVKQWAACRPKFFSSPLNSLRLVWCAGSPLDERTQDNMYRLLEPCVRVVQVWGMTEALWISTFLWPEKDHSASVGRLLPGIEAK